MTMPENPDLVGEFMEAYDTETPVVAGDRPMSLGQALAFERMFCPADPTDREDPGKRLRYLAGMLAAAGSLRPEHEGLLASDQD